jgi:butyryl-CoA dehydrogenase
VSLEAPVAAPPRPSPADRGEARRPNFSLTEDQELLREQVRRFAEERVRPGTAERDRDRTVPLALLAEAGELGLLAMMVPEEHNGSEVDVLSYALAIEELARVCPSTAVTVSVTNSVCAWPIVRFGSAALKKRVLPLFGAGALGGFGLTEPEAGSDAASLRTRARRDGDSWVLDGQKMWITNAGLAKAYVVVARTDADAGKRGLSAFVVESDAPGFSAGEPEHKMGLHASQTAALYFHECRIPADNLLGKEGDGLRIVRATLDHSRIGIAAQAVGIHVRALELAVEYARDRVQFGVPIAKHQAVAFQIAQMATELEAARVLTHQAALTAHLPSAGRFAAQAKLYASEAANRACQVSLQLHGGNGFHDDYEISRLYRDVRVTTIYEGTSEMQRNVIARHLLSR